jgi:Flp pilus assembly protein TadG
MKPNAHNREGGASLVEMALVMPVLLLILFGIMEFGLAFRDILGASQAAREGTRIAALAGNDPDADCAVIDGISDFLAANIDALDRVEIFRADSAGKQIISQTNVYTFSTGDPGDCTDWNSIIQWPSTSRKTTVGSQSLDIVGVRVLLDHDWVTNFPPFTGTLEIDESEIARVEPEAFE